MSKCGYDNKNINVYRSTKGREMILNPKDSSKCICNHPEFEEPDMLTIITPVVFDQVGINLCRFIPFPHEMLKNYPETASAILEVIDIDFAHEGVTTKTIINSPYCVRIILSDLLVTFSARLLDCCGKFIDNVIFRALYLDSNPKNECYHEETNPCQVILDLYAPFGPSFKDVKCSCEVEPVIQFLGLSTDNNTIPQGIVIQALAKVVDFDECHEGMSIGLTLHIKSIYALQYKIPHKGVSIPPKAELEVIEEKNSCKDFVDGDLLERKIKPLDLGDFCIHEKSCKYLSESIKPIY